MLKIYYYYKILQSIKSNNIKNLHIYLRKWNGKLFFNKLIKYAISYSYESFEILLSYMENKNVYFLYHIRQLTLENSYIFAELKKIFLAKFKNKQESKSFIKTVRLSIISELLNLDKENEVKDLVNELTEEEKKDLFTYAFDSSFQLKNEELIFSKIIDLLNIKKEFFDKEVFETYSALGIFIKYEKFIYIIKKYSFENYQFENLLLQTDNENIIKYIIKNIDIRYRILMLKVAKSLNYNYQYGSEEDSINTILFYKNLNVLNENLIKNSYNEDGNPIYFDYHYLNLLSLKNDTKSLIVKNFLNGLILHFSGRRKTEDEISITKQLDSYFSFIDVAYPNIHDAKSLSLVVNNCIQMSEEASVYFYDKFPNIFEINKDSLFSKFFINSSGVHGQNLLIKKICNEKNQVLKESLLKSFIKGLSETYYFSEDFYNIYIDVKDNINQELKDYLILKIAYKKEALKIIKDILNESDKKNIGEIFYNSISDDLSNAIYFIENYSIEKNDLSKSFLKLAYYNEIENESFNILAKKIVEKDIELNEDEQKRLQINNYELFRIYNAYFLNKKLSLKLGIKETKEKKTKI